MTTVQKAIASYVAGAISERKTKTARASRLRVDPAWFRNYCALSVEDQRRSLENNMVDRFGNKVIGRL